MSQTQSTKFLHLALTLALATPTMSAFAANDAMLQLLKVLHDKGTLDEETYTSLKVAAQADDEHNIDGQAEVKTASKTLPKVALDKGLKIESPEGDYSVKVGVRLQADGAVYAGLNSNNPKMGDGESVRRARLDVQGKIAKYWGFRLQDDFTSGGTAGIKDAYVTYSQFNPWYLEAGQFYAPFGLEQTSSDFDVTFIERAMVSEALTPNRRLGIAVGTSGLVGTEGGVWTAKGGLFGERAQDINTVPGSGNQGWNGVFRATIAPINTAGRLLHIGGGFRYHNPEDSQNALRFSAVPESTVANVGLLDTGFLGGAVGTQNTRISDFRQYGVELVGVWGPASVQGEWIRTDVSRNFGVPDVSVQGWYATASYFLTGESRPYRGAYVGEQAVMQRPTPRSAVGKGGYGAWELAARFSELDLTDASAALESQRLRGGREDNFTFGLNWYPTDTVRVLADYTHILSLSRPGIAFDDLNADIFELRAQLDWD